jgi:hypothetical protein
MKFAKYTFYAAGIYGLLVLLPQFFLEAKTSADYPPAITHAEYFYGFICVAVAFQVVFLIIGSDPVRYRPLMLVSALLEKFPFAVVVLLLYMFRSVPLPIVGGAVLDAILGILFLIAYVKTPKE